MGEMYKTNEPMPPLVEKYRETKSKSGAPAWLGYLKDKRMFYVLFRDGVIRVWISAKPTTDIADCILNGNIVHSRPTGANDKVNLQDGLMRLHTSTVLRWRDALKMPERKED